MGIEKEIVGEFRKAENRFFFTIKSRHACPKELSKISILFHRNRFLLIIIGLALGVFCNYWGMKNLRLTIQLIGFGFGFLIAFFLFGVIFMEGWISS